MVPREEFIRHAAACESIAKFSRDPENKRLWRRMAERWIRCPELAQEQDSFSQGHRKRKEGRIRWAQ